MDARSGRISGTAPVHDVPEHRQLAGPHQVRFAPARKRSLASQGVGMQGGLGPGGVWEQSMGAALGGSPRAWPQQLIPGWCVLGCSWCAPVRLTDGWKSGPPLQKTSKYDCSSTSHNSSSRQIMYLNVKK